MKISIYNRVRYLRPLNTKDEIKTGDIGYVIEDYGDGNFEVEFSDPNGVTRAQVVISGHHLESAEKS